MNTQQKEEILKALQLIKNICNSQQCEECPFEGSDGECGIHSRMPYNWNNKEPEQEETWRAFN